MDDVFISYAREDRARVQDLVQALEARGLSIWIDHSDIPPGATFDDVIERALDAARCVIVVWTAHSVASRWVRSEASAALDRNRLVPVLFESVPIPLEFRRVQTADLSQWRPGAPSEDFDRLVQSVQTLLGRAEPPAPPVRQPPPPPRHGWWRLAVAAAAVIAVAVWLLLHRADRTQTAQIAPTAAPAQAATAAPPAVMPTAAGAATSAPGARRRRRRAASRRRDRRRHRRSDRRGGSGRRRRLDRRRVCADRVRLRCPAARDGLLPRPRLRLRHVGHHLEADRQHRQGAVQHLFRLQQPRRHRAAPGRPLHPHRRRRRCRHRPLLAAPDPRPAARPRCRRARQRADQDCRWHPRRWGGSHRGARRARPLHLLGAAQGAGRRVRRKRRQRHERPPPRAPRQRRRGDLQFLPGLQQPWRRAAARRRHLHALGRRQRRSGHRSIRPAHRQCAAAHPLRSRRAQRHRAHRAGNAGTRRRRDRVAGRARRLRLHRAGARARRRAHRRQRAAA